MDNKDGKKKQGLNYEILLMKMKHEAEKQHDATERKRQCNHAHSTSSTESDVSPPDGGWGWVVCFGSFLVNFILDGTMFSFGLILLELLEEFGESKAKTSWIGSALLGLSMILGPFVGWLLDRYSLRQVTIGGALVATSGFVASFFAPNITVLTLTYGVIGGIGFCMMFLPAILVVGLYFSRRRAIATGIAMSGSGLGTFAYAYICDILLTYYNWRGTVLVLAGLILNCAVCGAIFRPIRKRMIKDNKTSGLTNTLCHCCTCVENSEKSSTESHEKHFFLRRNEEQVEQNLYNSTSILDKSKLRAAMFPNLKFGSDIQREYSSDLNLTKKRVRTLTDPSNPLSRKDIYYSGSIQNLHHPSIQVTEIQSDCESDKCEKTRRKWSCLNSKSKTVDFSLFRNRKFVLLLQCMTLWTAQSITLTYLPGMALANGLSRDQSAMLISICGVTNTLGRIGAGVATDVFRISSTHIYICALGLAGVMNCVLPLCSSFVTFAVCAAIFGLCMACAVCLRTILIAEHLGIERLTSAFSMIAFFQGVAFIINPPLAGTVYDISGSYLFPFLLTGGMYIISAIFCLPLLCMAKDRHGERDIVVESENSTDESLLEV